ncbi:RNA-binding ribosome biosynthesis protein mak21 [Recurvomyces mirabilis]|uniref:RNA-binding ribosome biosynthesis protein mak21 n=1 Tax=Recurvomyces mirabilis TaxID=574656 RepID=A0AAE0TR40_9PEZI|nr:RNA-binding ribosome biosynthesis protein mak21 [Recurvomyces mirabilis]
MAPKRKSDGYRDRERPGKKVKQDVAKQEKTKLIFEPRPEWHTAEVPTLAANEIKVLPPQHVVDDLHEYATKLLREENVAYTASHMAGSSSHKFMSTIMASGTLEDKISALTLMVQESPMHTMQAFDNLVALAKKRSRNQALMAVAALKDLLGQGVVLPADRKLRAFGKQPGMLSTLQGKGAKWIAGEALPGGMDKRHLMLWAYEDWLKRKFFELLQILETWCNDEVEYARSRALTYVFELLKDKPEQEENLLRLLVNKLGDTEKKIASRASYLLLQLENTHPAMRTVITSGIEADSLFRPGQSLHAKYYAVITLNQTILSQKEEAVANKLLEIYFSLFVQLLKPAEEQARPANITAKGTPQGGGGKAGKMAAKKRKAEERNEEAEMQTRDKLMSQVLAGVNRAFPFADTNTPGFEKQMDTIFRVAHSSNFNTAIQALMLIQQISSTKHYSADRFYRTLYESLLDPRLYGSSKQVMYLNLLYKTLKADLNAKRVQAFVKRLLQVIGMHEPAFACGVLYLISELETTFPSIRNMITEPEVGDEDEEEHFVDVPEDGAENGSVTEPVTKSTSNGTHSNVYDPRKRDPEHAHADRSCLWELLPTLQHFHPSVSLFASSILVAKEMPPKPDPQQHTLMHFLDRFVYRNAKTKAAVSRGASIMQPMAGSSAADLLVKPGEGAARAGAPVNSEAFWAKRVEDVAADEVFFHSYFNQAGGKKKGGAGKKEKRRKERDEEDSEAAEDDAEDEIWQAIAQSRPDVEGIGSDDDDLSFGDLEDGREDGSEPGLDLGGGDEDEDGAEGGAAVKPTADDFAEMDGFPELESDDDALLGSDEEAAMDLDDEEEEEDKEEEEEMSRNKKQRKQKKKLKALPTFASAEDYARLLADEVEDY